MKQRFLKLAADSFKIMMTSALPMIPAIVSLAGGIQEPLVLQRLRAVTSRS